MADKKHYYVNNEELYANMKVYREAKRKGKDPDRKTDNYIGKCIIDIVEHMITLPNFSGYTEQWKQEMKNDAIRNCVIACKTFDPKKSKSPFSFFTMVTWNAFIHRIKIEKKQNAIKHKNHQRLYFEEGIDFNDDISNQVIEDFERSLLTSKLKTTKINKRKGKKNEL